MGKFINLIKAVLFFPIYIGKMHVLGLKMKKKVLSLENEIENNLTYVNTVISSFLSKNCGINKVKRNHEITISLTSYSYRVDKVNLAIQSLMDQELKADRIVLHLDKSKFNQSNLPSDLMILESRGLTINFCKDIGPYTKLLPALKQYPENLIVTADDDLIYPRSFLRELYEAYLKNPQFIHCHRMHNMKFDANDKIKPYSEWDRKSNVAEPGLLVFPTGVGGILYPPGSLNDEVFNEEAFLTLSPGADDVWFKAMSLLNNVQCKKVDSKIRHNPITVRGTQEIGLRHQNLHNDKNDYKIKSVFNAYNLWGKFK